MKLFINHWLVIFINQKKNQVNAKKLKEAVAYIPLEKILLETDSPYLAPVPNRGKRNSSLNIPYIAEEIAKIKNISYEEVVEITRQNAEKLFGIK